MLGSLTNEKGSTDALLYWAVNLYKQGKDWKTVRSRSAKIGTAIHSILDAWPKTPTFPEWMTKDEVARALQAWGEWDAWMKGSKARVLMSEKSLTSSQLEVGGTFDLVLEMGREFVIADFKTGNHIDLPKVAAQLAAYAVCVGEAYPDIVCRKGLILHFEETGLNPIELSEAQMDAGLQLFKAARSAYRAFKEFPRT